MANSEIIGMFFATVTLILEYWESHIEDCYEYAPYTSFMSRSD